MNRWIFAFVLAACGGDSGGSPSVGGSSDDGSESSQSGQKEAVATDSRSGDSNAETLEPAILCPDVGPPCGFTVTYQPGGLSVGEYLIEVTTSFGVTTCGLSVEPERIQSPAEAAAYDAMLMECMARGDCPHPCMGPNTVYVGLEGLTVVEESTEITVTVQALETGESSVSTFHPEYAKHPAQSAECSMCRVAADSMSSP